MGASVFWSVLFLQANVEAITTMAIIIFFMFYFLSVEVVTLIEYFRLGLMISAFTESIGR